jgi:hypothetical protein
VSLRPKPRVLLVIAAAALAGVMLAFLLVPGSGSRRARPEVARPEPAAAPAPDEPPAPAPVVRPPRREPVVVTPPPAPRAAVEAREPEPRHEKPRPRERDRARPRERERPKRIERAPVAEDLHDARPPDPEPVASPVIEDLDEPEPAPTPPPPAAKPVAPPPAPKPKPAKVKEPEPEVEPRGSLDAVASLASIDVKGPLQDSEIRRGAGRVLSAFRSCYKAAAKAAGKTPSASVRLTFQIDESRTAKSISAGSSSLPGLTSCVVEAAGKIRTRIAPDVGTAQVTVRIEFEPTK